MLVLHPARNRSQGSDQGDSRSTNLADGQSPQEQDASPVREPVAVSLADIRHIPRLTEIPNDAQVIFSFGKEADFSAFGANYQGCKTISKGRIPGTDIPLPPVHFLRSQDLNDLYQRLEGHVDAFSVGARDSSIEVGALMDRANNLIEVGVPNVESEKLPAKLSMTGWQAKLILAKIVHEAAHGAGKEEFGAFRAEADFAHRIGLIPEPRTHLEIMLEIADLYSDEHTAVAKAQDEFEAACKKDRQQDQIPIYWAQEAERMERLEAAEARQAESAMEFPDDWDSEEAA